METRLQAVLFDLDGTLLDTAPDFASVLNGMRSDRNMPELPYEQIRQTVSHGARALVDLGFAGEPQSTDFADLHRELLDRYQACLSRQTRLFAGIEELLQFIERAGIPWGIVTNKPRLYTRAILDDLQLAQRCAVTVCPDDVENRKPHPESIFLACSQLSCAAPDALYVGDHRRDIEAGINAGSRTIAVAYGYASPDDPPQNWGADRLADSADDILLYIKQLTEQKTELER